MSPQPWRSILFSCSSKGQLALCLDGVGRLDMVGCVKQFLLIFAVMALTGCRNIKDDDTSANSGPTDEIATTVENFRPQLWKDGEPMNILPEWGKTGDGIFIDAKLRMLQRKSKVEKAWCGARSKFPVPSGTPVIISLFPGDGGKMYTYIGLTTEDVNVDSWAHGNRPEQYCLYYTDGQGWSGVHDSQYGKREGVSDYRGGVVPPIGSGEKLTIVYMKDTGTVLFQRNQETVYKGTGFEGDLYLSGSVKYPNEKIIIEDIGNDAKPLAKPEPIGTNATPSSRRDK